MSRYLLESHMSQIGIRKMLRAIYSGVNTVKGWRRVNKELQELYTVSDITNFVKVQRLIRKAVE